MTEKDLQKTLGPALGRIPSGVFILTVVWEGRESGMLASWVQQASFHPPMVLFAVQRGRAVAALLHQGTPFTLNVLSTEQTDMVAHFGKGFSLDQDAFHGLTVVRRGDQAPVLTDSLAFLAGRVVDSFSAGDHDVYLGELNAGEILSEGQPMVHVRKSGFHY